MRILRVLLAFTLVIAGVISTVGRGGGSGGGGGGFGNITSIPRPDLVITIENAQKIAATVVQAITQLIEVATIIGGQVFPSPPAAPDLLSSHSKFELFATVATTEKPVTYPCAVSGKVNVWGRSTNDPVSLSVGDTFDVLFDTCDDGDGHALDHRFTLTVTELDGDLRTDVFRLRYIVRNVSLTVASAMY